MRKERGFTLIELLVVIAIIGVLSSVVLASLNTARERGANARRMTDMRQLQTALELYALSNNGNYPNAGWSYACVPSTWTAIQNALSPHMSTLPLDPAQACDLNRQYYVITTASDYKILIHQPPSANSAPRSIWDPTRDNGSNPTIVDGTVPWGWAVYTPGGVSW